MGDEKIISFSYSVKPISFEKLNSQFVKARCFVLATGKNRNMSYISKESVDAALPSLKLVPVVAHLKVADDGSYFVGAHDREIVINDKGITLRDLTVPFGVVGNEFNPEYVQVTESDGSVAEYLAVDVILWAGRYPELMEAVYSEDYYFGQSMEIIPSKYETYKEDNNYMNIQEFEFSALCLLGRSDDELYHSEPCFPSAHVEPIQYELNKDKFKEDFALMMSELKNFARNLEEGGNDSLDEKLELLKKYNLTVESIDFNIEDFSLEELEEKIKEYTAEPVEFSATYRQKRTAIANALEPQVVKDEDGNYVSETYFYLIDFTDEHVMVEKDHWDADGYTCDYGRFTYSLDEAELKAVVTSEFEKMIVDVWLTEEEYQKIQDERNALNASFEALKQEFETYKAEYSTPNAEVEKLQAFEKETLETQRKVAEDELFNKFDKQLKGNEEYESLKETAKDYDLETLEKECFSILGRKTANFTINKQSMVKLPIDEPKNDEDQPYGGLFAKHVKK
ncbi:MAG TPA: hypothetical protein VFC62_00205 [Atopostipes sp.]|nr:hypothetical protein [Atopostipes sp.]